MPDIESRELHQLLSAQSGQEQVYLTGRATAAITLALSHRISPGALVVVSDIVCSHVPVAVLLAGGIPCFADIDPGRYTLSLESVKRALNDCGSRIEAIVIPQTYGYPVAYELVELAQSHGLFTLWDAAQSFFQPSPELPRDSVVVYSFGYSKFPCEGSGGALCSSDSALVAACRMSEKQLPAVTRTELQSMERSYRSDYYTSLRKACSPVPSFEEFRELTRKYRHLYLLRSSVNESALIGEINARSRVASKRREKTEYFMENLRHTLLRLPDIDKDTVPWRFTFTVSAEVRDGLLKELRSKDLHASAWYPACHLYIEPQAKANALVNAASFTDSVINLWIDESVGLDYQVRATKTILEVLGRRSEAMYA